MPRTPQRRTRPRSPRSAARPGKPGRSTGDVAAALASAAKTVRADYYLPHLAHAQMEPVAAIADVRNGKVDVWAPTQSPQDARTTLAEYLKVDAANVTVHVTPYLGGAFGRKSKPDFICEAAFLSREVGAPVRVQWSREDDLPELDYHTVAAHHLEAGLDANGRVTAWLHRSAYPAIGATFAPGVDGPPPTTSSTARATSRGTCPTCASRRARPSRTRASAGTAA